MIKDSAKYTQGPYIGFEAIRYVRKELWTHVVGSSNNLCIMQTNRYISDHQQ